MNTLSHTKSFFREIIIITLGVCIGMMLNTWNQNIIAKNEARSYLSGVYQEIEGNTSEITSSLAKHRKLFEKLNSEDEDIKLILHPAMTTDVAWTLAQNNIFKENVDSKLYLKIANLYALQNRIENSAEQASERMSELNTIVPYYTLSTFRMDIKDEEIKQIENAFTKRWKPIFESWMGYENEYLEQSKSILNKR